MGEYFVLFYYYFMCRSIEFCILSVRVVIKIFFIDFIFFYVVCVDEVGKNVFRNRIYGILRYSEGTLYILII